MRNLSNILMNRHIIGSFLLLCLAIISIPSCSNGESETGSFNLMIEDILGDKRDIPVSEIVDEIELIKLETTSQALLSATNRAGLRIAGGTRVIPFEDYILISQQNTAPYLFDRNGKFIRQISEIGRGPGEISEYYSTVFNKGDKCIYFLTDEGMNIKVFNINGDFLRNIKTDKLFTFQYVSDNLFCGAVWTNEMDNSKDYNYILFNDKGDIVKKIKLPGFAEILFFSKDDPQKISGSSIRRPRLSYSSSGTHINTLINDTIFTISDDKNIQNSLTWFGGKYKSPYSLKEASTTISPSELSRYLRMPSIFETEKYWFLSFVIEKVSHRCVLDKSTGEAFELNSFKNDIGEFLFTIPSEENIYGNQFIHIYEVVDLKKKITSKQFLDLEKEFPQEAQEVRAMINELDEEDNVIIMIMTLK
jgi:hypothetical protein